MGENCLFFTAPTSHLPGDPYKPLGETTPRSHPLSAKVEEGPISQSGGLPGVGPHSQFHWEQEKEQGIRVGHQKAGGGEGDHAEPRKKGTSDRRLGGVRAGRTRRPEWAPRRAAVTGRRWSWGRAAAGGPGRPAESLRGQKGHTGAVRGSSALTALLSQEHQLEFPQRIPEVSARGHNEAGGGAAAASAHRPLPERCSYTRLTKRVERKGSRRVLSAPAGPGGGARLKGALLSPTGGRRRPQSGLAPCEARGRGGRQGGVGGCRGALGLP